jgi:hypothetical protein
MDGFRIIIPCVTRKQVLHKIHQGHRGVTKYLLRAKSAVYWPGMYKEIESTFGNCGACKEFENAQAKCPMIHVEVPEQLWHTVGADLFHYEGSWFLLVTDAYSMNGTFCSTSCKYWSIRINQSNEKYLF